MSSNCLWSVDDGEGVSFVLAPTLVDALHLWKEAVAGFINEDYAAEGIDRQVTASEISDPVSIEVIGTPEQLLF